MPQHQTLGQMAYAAYAAATKGKDGLGRDIPPWATLPLPDQQVWITLAELLGVPHRGAALDADTLGRIAYNAYCAHVGWKGWNGDPLPHWEIVRPDIKAGWLKAGLAVNAAADSTVESPERAGALKYELIPDAGDGCRLPTSPEGMTAEELGAHVTGRLLAMERQGHWRNNRGSQVALEDITYTIKVEEPMDPEDSEPCTPEENEKAHELMKSTFPGAMGQ